MKNLVFICLFFFIGSLHSQDFFLHCGKIIDTENGKTLNNKTIIVSGNKILSINYEDVVNNFEVSVKKILDYCELPFEKACLEFYKSKRSVKTPSAEQVRQPIYTSGMDYWKNYEPYLDDLKNNLKY